MFQTRRTRRAAAAVEFAIVAPIFLLGIVFPMIEFGRAMTVANSLAATAAAGCRVAVLPGNSNTTVRTAIANNLGLLGIATPNPAVITVNGAEADVSTAKQGDTICVTISVPYTNVSWLPVGLNQFLKTITLSSSHTMRHE
jgi:Flp pilus assembly protein TadG